MIRRLKRLAGSEAELHRWVTTCCQEPVSRGGRPVADDESTLDLAAFLVREVMIRNPGVERLRALELLAEEDGQAPKTAKATARRLYRKIDKTPRLRAWLESGARRRRPNKSG
jgi:hypothetical protein